MRQGLQKAPRLRLQVQEMRQAETQQGRGGHQEGHQALRLEARAREDVRDVLELVGAGGQTCHPSSPGLHQHQERNQKLHFQIVSQ